MDGVKVGDQVRVIKEGENGKIYEVESTGNEQIKKIKLKGKEGIYTIFELEYLEPRKFTMTISHNMTTVVEGVEAKSIEEAKEKAREAIEEEFNGNMSNENVESIDAEIFFEQMVHYSEED